MLTKTSSLSENTWCSLGDRNRGPETRIFKTSQSAKVREGSAKGNAKVKLGPGSVFTKVCSPRRLREGKREAGNMHVKSSQSAKVPRRFREEKREGVSKSMVRVSVTFLDKYKGITMSTLYAFIPGQQPASCLSCQSCDRCLSL